MNTEEKAKAYDEALERAKDCLTDRKFSETEDTIRSVVEYIFSELAESEDERIRKAIESIIRVYGKTQGEWIAGYDMDTLVVHLRDAFACLEKQKDLDKMIVVSPEVWDNAISEAYENGKKEGEKQKEQKPLTAEETELNSIAFLEQMGYTCIPPGKEQKPAEWSPTKEQMVALSWAANGMLDNDSPSAGDIKASLRSLYNDLQSKSIKPAEWSEKHIADIFEKVGLAKIAREQGNDELTNALQDAMLELSKAGNAKWSEVDEHYLNSVIRLVHGTNDGAWGSCIGDRIENWLKSIPERFTLQQKKEWSEEDIKRIRSEEYTKGFNDAAFGSKLKEWSVEDEDRIRQIERIAQAAGCTQKLQEEIHDWLKSLRPQSKQEWSEVELEFRGEKIKVKRPFFRDDKGRGYSTTEQDEEVAWNALRAWCEKKGISLYDLYPKVEWGEEDEEIFNNIIEKAKGGHWIEVNEITWLITRFKSLRPSWKPSEEQMKALPKGSK